MASGTPKVDFITLDEKVLDQLTPGVKNVFEVTTINLNNAIRHALEDKKLTSVWKNIKAAICDLEGTKSQLEAKLANQYITPERKQELERELYATNAELREKNHSHIDCTVGQHIATDNRDKSMDKALILMASMLDLKERIEQPVQDAFFVLFKELGQRWMRLYPPSGDDSKLPEDTSDRFYANFVLFGINTKETLQLQKLVLEKFSKKSLLWLYGDHYEHLVQHLKDHRRLDLADDINDEFCVPKIPSKKEASATAKFGSKKRPVDEMNGEYDTHRYALRRSARLRGSKASL